MNIVDLLRGTIQHTYDFFESDAGAASLENYKRLALGFLRAPSEGMRDLYAGAIIAYALHPHAKGHVVGSFGDILNMKEQFDVYKYEKNRKHLNHSVNVFLLGLLLYHSIEPLRRRIHDEMENSSGTMLSGGSAFGEFLFRWRLASLMHDVGNGVSLFGAEREKISEYIYLLMLRVAPYDAPRPWTVEDLLPLERHKQALDELDRLDCSKRISRFFNKLKGAPYESDGSKIFYDHGVVSALILLKVLDLRYRDYDNTAVKEIEHDGHRVSFDRDYFDKSIMQAAYAITTHNVDMYPAEYRVGWPARLYSVKERPLAFLLKVADTLQEWGKPRARNGAGAVSADEVELEVGKSGVVVRKFPDIRSLKEKLGSHFETDGLIEVKGAS